MVKAVVNLWAVGGVAVGAVILLFFVVQYNRMVSLRNRCKESWSNVDTELKRRYELIPNLVATVQGYAKHEQGVMEAVVRARAAAMGVRGAPHEVEGPQRQLVAAVGRLMAVAEAYPDLKASRNFLQLQEELANTEDRIQAARRFYNGNVRDYLNQVRQFPGSIVAGMFGFRDIDYFQVESVAMRAAPGIAFGGMGPGRGPAAPPPEAAPTFRPNASPGADAAARTRYGPGDARNPRAPGGR